MKTVFCNGPKTLFCVDPSLCNTGWAIVRVTPGSDKWVTPNHFRSIPERRELLAHGIIKTAPEAKKRRIYQADDDARRAIEIYRRLCHEAGAESIDYVISEQPSGGSKSAKAARAMGIAAASVACFSVYIGAELRVVHAQDVKKHHTGSRSGSKLEIQRLVARGFPGVAAEYPSRKPDKPFCGDFEHVADAIAAGVAFVESGSF